MIRAFTQGASITESSKAKVLAAAEKLNYGAPLFVAARDCQIEGVPRLPAIPISPWRKSAVTFWRGLIGGRVSCRAEDLVDGARTAPQIQGSLRQERDVELMEFSAERYSVDAGAEVARAYLERTSASEPVDVLMRESDALAFGAMDVIRSEYALRIPQDISVVGFDNTALAGSPTYNLTTYE